MAEDEKTDLAAAAPALEIPDLKKKEEEERKRGGVVLGSGKPGAGLGVGNGAAGARAAASVAARAAAVEALGASGSLGVLASLTATFAGKALIAAVVALVLGAAAVVAHKLRPGGAASGGPDLGGVGSSLKPRKGGGDRTFAFGGLFGGGQDPARDDQSSSRMKEEGLAARQAQAPANGGEQAGGGRDLGLPGDRLAHDLSGAKLATELGASGGKTPLSGAGGAMLSSGFDLSKISAMDPSVGQKGKLSKIASNVRPSVSGRRTVTGARSQRAIAQAKLAGSMTKGISGATQEGARTMAADAFDGGKTNGGVLNAFPPASVGGTMVGSSGGGTGPGGAGGAGGSGSDSGLSVPADLKGTIVDDASSGTESVAPTKDVTGWAGPVTTALDMAQKSYEMKNQSMILFGLSAAATVAGIALLATGISVPAAAIAFAAAAALAASGAVMLHQAVQMKEQASVLGRQIKDLYGQEYQKEIIDQCLEQALAGTKPAECDPATKPDPKSNTRELVEQELNSNPQMDSEPAQP